MLIPSLAETYLQTLPSLSRGMNANSQLNSRVKVEGGKSIKRDEC